MQDIKVRGIRKEGNSLTVNFTLQQLVEGAVKANYDDYHWSLFTGLLDKSGKEIYENDVVEVREWQYSGDYAGKYIILGRATVAWVDDAKFMVSADPRDETDKFCIQDMSEDNEYIVLGNIHENPELIEQE